MDARTVLLVTYHFPPSAGAAVHRMLGLVRHLPRYGWRPVIVAPSAVKDEPSDPDLCDLVPRETPVYRVPFPAGYLGKVAFRLAGYNAWLPSALSSIAKILPRHRPDVMLTSSPPPHVHYLGMLLQKRYGLPWVADLRDPWAINKPGLKGWRRRFAHLMERRTVRQADAVVANTPLCLEGLTDAYPGFADKMCVIPNGFDAEHFPPPLPRERGPCLEILHAGELYNGRDPRPFLQALRETNAAGPSPAWQATFIGRSTDALAGFSAEVAQLDQVPYTQSLERMLQADVLLLLQRPNFPQTVPAKLYEYLGAGRPILALAEPDGDIAWVLRRSGVVHRIVLPGEVGGIKQALGELRLEVLKGSHAQTAGTAAFTRANMARGMAAVLDRHAKPLAVAS